MFYHFHDGFIFSQVGSFKWIIFFIASLSYPQESYIVIIITKLKLQRHKISAKICTEKFRAFSVAVFGEIEFGMRTMQFTVGECRSDTKSIDLFSILATIDARGSKKRSCAHKNNENFIANSQLFRRTFRGGFFARAHRERLVGFVSLILIGRFTVWRREREKSKNLFCGFESRN